MAVALVSFVLALGGLTIDTSSPDALCPALSATRQAVVSRLGHVDLEGTWAAQYVVVHRNRGDFVDLELRDPKNQLRLKRQIPVRGESCATLSQVIALVLERFFLEPQADGSAPGEGGSGTAHRGAAGQAEATGAGPGAARASPSMGHGKGPPPLSKEAHGPSSVEGSADPGGNAIGRNSRALRLRSPEPAPPVRIRNSRCSLGSKAQGYLGVGGWLASAWAGPMVSAGLRSGCWGASLSTVLDVARHRTSFGPGQLELWRLPLTLGLAGELWADRRHHLGVGAEFVATVETAEALNLASNSYGTRLVPGVGLLTELARDLADRRLQGVLGLAITWIPPVASEFRVDNHAVLSPPAVVASIRVGVRAFL